MTAKRFRSGLAKNDEFSDEIIDELTGKHYFDSTKDDYVFSEEIVDLLNELYEENKQIKDLIHTMLKQIDAENITSDSAIYSAKIIFSRNEFSLIREMWKRS